MGYGSGMGGPSIPGEDESFVEEVAPVKTKKGSKKVKTSKTTSHGTYDLVNCGLNLNEKVGGSWEEVQEVRPMGQDRAKKKVTSSSSHSESSSVAGGDLLHRVSTDIDATGLKIRFFYSSYTIKSCSGSSSIQHHKFLADSILLWNIRASTSEWCNKQTWTVKGLRDRRIRLSVPTAIDLYHLQDKLGLAQPSKVIDWLLDVTKDDIDKLPPLQMALEDFNRFHLPSTCVPQDFHSTKLSFSPYFNTTKYDHQRTRGNEAIGENKPKTFNYHELHFSPNVSLSRPEYQLDTYASLLPVPPALAPPFEPQVSCFSGVTTPSFFSPYFMPNHFQLLSSNSPHGFTNSLVPIPLNLLDTKMKLPFGLNMNTNVSSQRNDNE
nr:hypothetical protein [Tanacetum cinerariifolium]